MFGKPSATARRFWTVVATLAVCFALLPMAVAGAATAYTLTINDVAAAELNAGTQNFTFTVSLTPAVASGSVTVNYATADGTAAAPGDYTSASGTLTFAAGESSKTIPVVVNGNLIYEGGLNETFFVNLSGAAAPAGDSITIADAQGVGTILDDADPVPTVNAASASALESAGSISFLVTLTNAAEYPVTVTWDTDAGTANNPVLNSDFIDVPNTALVFAAGELSKSVSVSLVDDAVPEATETFALDLSAATGGVLLGTDGVGTIIDNDQPTITVANVSQQEGISPMTFELILSTAPGAAASVQYQTVNGTALSGTDYTATGLQTCNFGLYDAPDPTPDYYRCLVDVTIAGDGAVEPDETFQLLLSNPVNAVIGTASATGTILDDEGIPTVSIANATAGEAAGTMNFILTLSASYFRPITVDYFTWDGTAVAPGDYTTQGGPPAGLPAPKTLTIPAGATTATLSVPIIDDTRAEDPEGFYAIIGNPTFATLGTGGAGCGASYWPAGYCAGLGTITDNDKPVLSVGWAGTNPPDGPATEGVAGYWIIPFVTLDADPSTAGLQTPPNSFYPITFDGETLDISATGGSWTCPAGIDYEAFDLSGTLAAGETSKDIWAAFGYPAGTGVFICNDAVVEADEAFSVLISNAAGPKGVTIGTASRNYTIKSEDLNPTVKAYYTSPVLETALGLGFELRLEGNATTKTVTVQYATSNGTATAGLDYAAASGTATFAPGVTSLFVPFVGILDDAIYEGNETFSLTLSGAVNAGLEGGGATKAYTATITDNEPMPTVNIGNATAGEAAGTISFPVTLTNASAATITVSVLTPGTGTATINVDYTGIVGAQNVTFAPGELSKTVTIPVLEDALVEGSETFHLNLGALLLGAATLGTNGTGTITDNDLPQIKIVANTPAGELEDSQSPMDFTLSIANQASIPGGVLPGAITVLFATANGTATGGASCIAGIDYQTTAAPPAAAIGWAAGESVANTKALTVPFCTDLVDEPNETFIVTLSSPTGATLAAGFESATGTIKDDDVPNVTINDVAEFEGNAAAPAYTSFVFTITATSTHTVAMNIPWTIAPLTTDGADHVVPLTGTAIIAAGSTTVTVTARIQGDLLEEADEVFTVTLGADGTPPTDYTLGAKFVGYGTVRNDDIPMVSINDVSKTEGNAGVGIAAFTVTMSNPRMVATAITCSIAAGGPTPGTAGADFTGGSCNFTIAAGATSATVNVPVIGDTTDEADETFVVNLSGGGVGYTDGQGLGTILDDDLDTTAPVVTVPANMTVEATGPTGAAATFVASATDLPHAAPTVTCVPASGSMFPLGPTTVHCTATDASGNMGHASFMITVVDTTPPIITLNGSAALTIPYGSTYIDAGATASDLVDGDLTGHIVTVNPVDTFAVGSYLVTYNVTDSHGNHAAQVTRTVTVAFYCGGLQATIIGTAGDDTLTGTAGPDVIFALDGADTIYGLGGADTICGGPGNDMIYGGEDADWIYANAGADMLHGEGGSDYLYGGAGNDRFMGGAGDDLMFGGNGWDLVDYSGAGAMNIDLYAQTASGEGADSLVSFERIIGSAFDDTLIGGPANNTIWGGGGNDMIWGAGGNDLLYGEDGDDSLYGNGGDDTLWGGPGEDLLIGGLGSDSIDGFVEP